jgi:NosR/NirI family transcriptional regulator, nitrous oxide reductase regulator
MVVAMKTFGRPCQYTGTAALIGLLLLVLAPSVVAELIPTPEFANHPVPTTTVPDAPASWWQAIDLGVLVVALGLASYFALVKRSRRALFVLTIASLGWFGFWRGGCICPIGAIQNVSLAAFDATYIVPLTVVVLFVLPMVFTLFFGRTFCAAVCPLGAAQELVAVRTVTVPPWLDHALGLCRYIYLGAAVLFAATGTAFIIFRYDPFVAFFRLSGSASMLVFGGSLLLIGVVVGRPYCRYLCPYGAILGLLSSVAKWHVRIPPNECINCRLCEDVCPYGAIQPPTIDLSAAQRRQGRRRLVMLLAVTPLLVAVLAWLGTRLATPLAWMDPEVRLAEQVRQEELGQTETTTDASDAFRAAGRSVDDLYATAIAKRARFATLGGYLGGWVGLVIGLKLIHLSLRRRRVDYRTDRSGCVSCARCFWYCPNEQLRLGLIEDVSELVDAPVTN